MSVAEGIAFPLCALGQMYVAPSRAAVIMSFDSVVAVLLGYLCLNETFSAVESIGCLLLLGANISTASSSEGEDDGQFGEYMRIPEEEEEGEGGNH